MLKKGDKKVINAWAFYDWANSVYSLVITTAIFPIYYEAVTSEKDAVGNIIKDTVLLFGKTFKNTEIYSYTISLSFLLVSILSPFLSGVADYSGRKRRFLQLFCWLGSISCAMLFFFNGENLSFGLFFVLLASVGFWGSLVFYNGFLPEIADPKDHDRISAKGFAMGYIGSSLLLIVNLILIQGYDMPATYSFVLVGAWWLGFGQLTFRRLPDNVYDRKPAGNYLGKGIEELKKVWKQLGKTKRLKRYLISFFIYSMGVQTVMLMATLFGTKEVPGMETSGLIISVLVIQFVAIPGAYGFSSLSKRYGNVPALAVALVIWIGICVGALFIDSPLDFYIAAGFVGLVMGGVQSLSRSTYSKFLPKTQDHASFFSFYDVCEKIGIVIGTFSYGYIEGLTGSMRNSIFALIAFFVVGLVLLMRVPKEELAQ